MSTETITPALHTPRGPQMNHGAILAPLSTIVAGMNPGSVHGGHDHVRFAVKVLKDKGADRFMVAIKATGDDLHTVEIGQVDKTTSVPTYGALFQRTEVPTDQVCTAVTDLYADLVADQLPPIPDHL